LKSKWLISLLLFFCTFTLSAQVRWWGIYDFEIQKGGPASSPDLNSLPNNYLQVHVGQFQLFTEAEVSKSVTVMAMIANNPPKTFDLKQLEVRLACVTFNNLLGNALSICAGKILTPFGRFAKRQLAPDNPLIGQPLFFTYPLNVSSGTGYLDSAGSSNAQAQYGGRLNTIYNGGYYVGAEAFGSFLDGLTDYDVAIMNAPLSYAGGDYNVNKDISFHGRAAIHPAIWGTLGASYAVGSFMQPAWVNQYFDSWDAPVGSFKQTTYGLDLLLSYLYYELNAEYISNRFNSPYIVLKGGYLYDNGLKNGLSLNLDNQEYLVDLKLEAPFYPGLYMAIRYDHLMFDSIKDPASLSSTYGTSIQWGRNANRYAVALGYKPEHSILFKLGVERTEIDVHPKPNLDVVSCAMVITF
jgi:hypothetical protein